MPVTNDLDRALGKVAKGWLKLSDKDKALLLLILHDDIGLTLKDMGEVLGLSSGQIRYAWFKRVQN